MQGEVLPGENATITSYFSALTTQPGIYNALLKIVSNDPFQPLTILSVCMNVLQPNHPPVINLPENFSFNANESLLVDFTPYVSDPDNDPLTLTCSGNTNINVTITGLQVSLSSLHNWYGTEIIFYCF